eukprot:2156174-Alexandrium_andersonii.AAC.1
MPAGLLVGRRGGSGARGGEAKCSTGRRVGRVGNARPGLPTSPRDEARLLRMGRVDPLCREPCAVLIDAENEML